MSTDLLERLKTALADRYAVESEIGRGGMATVFLAEDPKHGRKVAIKVLHPELAASVGTDRFLREIETVAGLTHPHVLPLHDSGEADGLLYFVMPYVKGENLRQRLEREKQLPVDDAIRIAGEVAGALDHAHREGVIHRDIKPANILLEEGHAVVADFGVARAVSAAGGESVTATGMAVGTPAYMSPEQAAGEEVDERSDLYALGCILYEMLAGEPPLVGATPQATAAKRLANTPTPLSAIRNTVPANLAALAERALAPTAADRPATAHELADELEEVRRIPGPAARRSPAARWLVPLIGVAVLGGAAVLSQLGSDGSATRDLTLLPAGAIDLGPNSVAVFPLANVTGMDSLDWYGAGLMDLLIVALGQIEDLRVVSGQRLRDLMRQAGHEETERIPEDLALSLAAGAGAHRMVYGSYFKLGDEFQLDTQLIDLSDGTVTGVEQARGKELFALVDAVSPGLSSRVLGRTIAPTELTSAAQLTTASPDAYREYQEGLLAEHRFLTPVAEEHYQRAVELDSTFALPWLRLGMRALSERDDRLAASYLQRADEFSADASERDRLMIQAFTARVSREWDEYTDQLEDVVLRHPDEKEARYYLGLAYGARGQPEDGWRMLETVLALDPYYSAAVNQLAYWAASAGDEAAADSLTLRYIELEPDIANGYDTRGDILEMFGRDEEARAMFRDAIGRVSGASNRVWLLNRLVNAYLREGDSKGARTELQAPLTSDDPDIAIVARMMLANTYAAEGRYVDALFALRTAVEKAKELGADGSWVLAEVGFFSNMTGAYEEAETAFNELLEIERYHQAALFGILGTYGRQERFDEMSRVREAASAVLDSAPDFMRGRFEGTVRFADGLIAWYRGDAEETVRLFEEARAAAGIASTALPELFFLPTEEVLALIEVGRASDALGVIDEIDGFAEGDGSRFHAHAAWYLRGRACEGLGETERALESYQQLLDVAGEGVREVVLFRDTPERVARLRGEG
jgi:tetratricopeptide (TPR) repeat protein